MTSFSNWLRANRKNFLLTFFSIFITLLIGEAGLQLYYRYVNKSWLWQYNNFHITYVKPIEDRRRYALRPSFSDSQIGISVNEKGFRAPPSMTDPGLETPVIVTLGDSKSFGVGARDEETYAYYIGQRLEKDGSPIRAVNGGVPSYNMRQVLDRFKIDVLPNYNPKIVILQGAFNDISLLTYYRENWNPDRTWADIRFAEFTEPLPGFQKIATMYYFNRAIENTSAAGIGKVVEYETYPDDEMLKAVPGEMRSLSYLQGKINPVVFGSNGSVLLSNKQFRQKSDFANVGKSYAICRKMERYAFSL